MPKHFLYPHYTRKCWNIFGFISLFSSKSCTNEVHSGTQIRERLAIEGKLCRKSYQLSLSMHNFCRSFYNDFNPVYEIFICLYEEKEGLYLITSSCLTINIKGLMATGIEIFSSISNLMIYTNALSPYPKKAYMDSTLHLHILYNVLALIVHHSWN